MRLLLVALLTFPAFLFGEINQKSYIYSDNCPEIVESDFKNLVESIENISDDEKFKKVKLTMRYYCVHAEQLLEIMHKIN